MGGENKNKKKRITAITAATAVAAVIFVWILWGNKALTINKITVKSDRLPRSFSGFRIAQISDLHNAEFGDGNMKLIEKLKESEPDVIVFTGDLADSYRTDIDIAVSFAEKAIKIAPCYFVAGNHEARIGSYSELLDGLAGAGVRVLQNEAVVLKRDDESITLLGVDDPSFQADYLFGDEKEVMDSVLFGLTERADGYTVLLSHRPELFDVYVLNNVDLVLSGHAHGGQFRLPFVGGVFAPGQGFFPKYDAGLYCENNTGMVVSRGIGNSLFPFRVNNRPEIVLVELNK